MFENGRISAIYDFDSLAVGPEAFAVGRTCVDYMGRRGRGEICLDPHRARGFVQAYENVAGRLFSGPEREILLAGAVTRLTRKAARFERGGIHIPGLPGAIVKFAEEASRILVSR
jgi:hypothetical protein